MKLQVDGTTAYAKLGDVSDSNATSLLVYRNSDNKTYAVLKAVADEWRTATLTLYAYTEDWEDYDEGVIETNTYLEYDLLNNKGSLTPNVWSNNKGSVTIRYIGYSIYEYYDSFKIYTSGENTTGCTSVMLQINGKIQTISLNTNIYEGDIYNLFCHTWPGDSKTIKFTVKYKLV